MRFFLVAVLLLMSIGLSAIAAPRYSVYRGTTTGGENVTAVGTGLTSVSYTDSSVSLIRVFL
jgi:hypothetical protein